MRRFFNAAFLGLITLCTSVSPAAAEVRKTANGTGSGDRSMEYYCPAGQILVGYAGRSGLWLDAVQAVCAPLRADGLAGDGVPQGPVFGGNGGGQAPIGKCPAGSLMEDVGMTLTVEGKQVAGITLYCRGADGRSFTGSFGNPGYKPGDDGIFIKNRPAIPSYDQRCPGGTYPVGIHGAVGKHVNRLGTLCEAVAKPAAPAAPKPIKTTGRARPTAVMVTAFQGYWVTTSSLGERYALVLQTVGSPIGPGGMPMQMQVVGQILDPDTKKGIGSLTGMIQPNTRQLQFSYGVDGGGGGGVLILANDGQSITGNVNQSGKGSGVWNGVRGK